MALSSLIDRFKQSFNKPALSADGKAKLWLFFVFLLITNLPNLLWLQPNTSLLLNGAEYVERLLLCLLLTACFLCLFTYPKTAWLCLWLLFLWWLPLALGVRAIAGTPISATLIGTTVATSPAELRNLLGSTPWPWFIFFVVWNLLCLLMLHLVNCRPDWRWSWGFRGKTAFFCLAMLALPHVVLSGPQPVSASAVQMNDSIEKPAQNTKYSLGHPLYELDQADKRVGFSYRLPDAFPYELPWAIAQYIQARRAVNAIRANLQKPDTAYSMAGHKPAADVVVLVIGESSTRNAWHWFNPLAPTTTPRLEAQAAQGEHLFGFGRTLAQSTATREAVPSMLTAQPLIWPDGTPNPQATYSIVSAAQQAGYATAWFSNQAAVGKHDGIIASYAEEATTTAFLNPSSFYAQGSYDEVLLPALQRHLDTHKQVFVVLHTMGSHFNYQHRYPTGFGLYPNTSDEREAYFNSVAYTDYVLDKVIDTVAKDGRKAVLVYAADHGESIPGGSCDAGVANRNTRDAYEVPALVWLSRSYAKAYPKIAKQLNANTNTPYNVAAVAQTLLDLMRGNTETDLPDPTNQSFARNNVFNNEHGQKVKPVWTQQFEQAVERNPCFMILR